MITFQSIISKLESYWAHIGCSILHSYDIEVGAGTLSPHTALRVLDMRPWNVCYVQYSRRPSDARFAANPNRLSGFHQFQVILKPSPSDIQALCKNSLTAIGLDISQHDIRFVEDDWENPSVGASGLGFEVWCDGMEIMQFTYMQRMCGIDCKMIAGEITYGLERLAMHIQGKVNVLDIIWNIAKDGNEIKYSDIWLSDYEIEQSTYYQKYHHDNDALKRYFEEYKAQASELIERGLIISGYEYCLKASHVLNILDARRLLSHNERTEAILAVRTLASMTATEWLNKHKMHNID